MRQEQVHARPDADSTATTATHDVPASSGRRPLRVVIVDDHLAFSKGVALILADEGHSVLDTPATARDGLASISRHRPDVAIVDVALGDESGMWLAEQLAREVPATPIVLYTGLQDTATLGAVLDSPAQGFLMKAGPPEDLLEALHAVGDGRTYVDKRLHSMLLEERKAQRKGVLGRREREVLSLLASGATGEQIAKRLFLSPETVKTHIRNATAKLHARTRTEAVVIGLATGEIELPDRADGR